MDTTSKLRCSMNPALHVNPILTLSTSWDGLEVQYVADGFNYAMTILSYIFEIKYLTYSDTKENIDDYNTLRTMHDK